MNPCPKCNKPLPEDGKCPSPECQAADSNTILATAVGELTREFRESRAAAREPAPAADIPGVDFDALGKAIDEADAAGQKGAGIAAALKTVTATVGLSVLDRDGKREIAGLALSRAKLPGTSATLSEAFEKHGPAFKAWIEASGFRYTQFADPERAEETFRYFIVNKTPFLDERRTKEREADLAADRARIEKDATLRRAVPSSPSLPGGARSEGGALHRLVHGATGPTEATEAQAEIMTHLGLSPDRQKAAMETHAKKTKLGTPLDFVTVTNEGAVT